MTSRMGCKSFSVVVSAVVSIAGGIGMAQAQPTTTEAKLEAAISEPGKISSPFYNDPNYQSAADPEVVWNAREQEWWVFYTARRMIADVNPGCGGTPVGVCASKDLVNWRFVGYCKLDGVGGEKDVPYTAWAPGIITAPDGTVHLYLTYKKGADGFWGSGGSTLRHYVARDGDLLNGWTSVSDLTPESDTIDAGLLIENGKWTMVYRDIPPRGSKPGTIYHATSDDGATWTFHGQLDGDVANQKVNGAGYQEAPYLFQWKGHYWMLTDQGHRVAQYRSDDLKTWTFTGPLLEKPGVGPLGLRHGQHPSVAVIGDRAFVFYFNHPYKARDESDAEKRRQGRSWLHISEITMTDDGRLACDRSTLVTPPAVVVPETPRAGR